MKSTKHFLTENFPLLSFGFCFSLFSAFGQTFVISLYVPYLQHDFNLSDSLFSSMYGVATLAGAFTINWLGRYIDKIRLTKFSIRVLLAYSFALILFSQSYYVPVLFLAIYGVRLFGQGLMIHISITSMARFFNQNRGKAISLSALGHPFSEAFLPIVIVTSLVVLGWRVTLLLSAALVLMVVPLTLYLLLKNNKFSQLKMYFPAVVTHEEVQQAKTSSLLKNKFFWIMAPTGIVSGAVGTGFLFFQLKLGEIRNWSPEFIAAAFAAYAIANAITGLLGGWLSDRFTGKKLFSFTLLPFALGLLTLVLFNGWWVYVVFIASIGFSNGFGSSVKNTAMAELFGTKLLGSVRSLFTTLMVFSTALGPLVFGLMLDAGYSFEFISIAALVLFVLATVNGLRILKC
jgi:MFS family permease